MWYKNKEIMTKEEKIKDAWGVYWDSVKNHHQYDGWINRWAWDFRNELQVEELNGENISPLVRPKSLKGIKNNNGWNSMEQPDFEENEYVLFLRFINGEGEPPIFTCVLCDDFEIGYFTHWKRVDYEKPPIY